MNIDPPPVGSLTLLTIDEIKAFERELDAVFEALPSLRFDGETMIALACDFIEKCHKEAKQHYMGAHFARGLDALLPVWITSKGTNEPDIKQMLGDLHFGASYFMLREYLYYTYNTPETLKWYKDDDGNVTIKINDPTLTRQYYLKASNGFVGSMETFKDNDPEKILALVRGTEEFSQNPVPDELEALIMKEVDQKLSVYFNYLEGAPDVQLGQYTFGTYKAVFRLLLFKALYHRYHSMASGKFSMVEDSEEALITMITTAGVATATEAKAILRDITYGPDSAKRRLQPMYYSFIRLPRTNAIIIRPHHFATWEGYINILRIIALKNAALFLRNISNPLGDQFTEAIAEQFRSQGFLAETNVSLSRYDTTLPDIDLLVISEEPTLGYVVLACETKSPVPAQWAKDYLRVLNDDSVAKAFRQLDSIDKFLSTKEGVEFIMQKLPGRGHPHFEGSVVVLRKSVVITSDNSGLFFGKERHVIMDHQTLKLMLAKCDGDMAYVLGCFSKMNEWCDRGAGVEDTTVQVGNRSVTYEGVALKSLLGFSQNEYKSTGVDKQMLADFIEEGHHPFDVLPNRPDREPAETKAAEPPILATHGDVVEVRKELEGE